MDASANLREISSVDQILKTAPAGAAIECFGRIAVTQAIRAILCETREKVRQGKDVPSREEIAAAAFSRLDANDRPMLRSVFNLTGTVLHTNLGRAILAEAAVDAAAAAMREAVALEFDLNNGKRGERDDHLRALICELTGAEDATVVNNNAAAVLLVLNSLAADREAIVSRGELIEIGGAFRMPDIMERAGVRLVEVGTTNRTHARDYRDAIGPDTGLILKVHTSNYRIEGFTKEVGARELSGIAHDKGVPLINDLGSGTLVDLVRFGLAYEPTVREAICEGADVVTFSGDKLLGGPQAGFIVGRRTLIETINKNPMKRALRVDKIRLAALEATLKLYRDPERLGERLPVMRLLTRSQLEIKTQAERLAPVVKGLLKAAVHVSVVACESQIGSGALPLSCVPSAGLALTPIEGSGSALAELTSSFRRLPIPVIGRIERGSLVLDLRCLEDEESFAANLMSLPAGQGRV
ncbi:MULTISPECIES: L-seryl-tRNA(Sec) selenium transferase [Rhizobium]|uniref:L-seryl-tRNA(Sec) selenium transferase n=1 Tax=Rhizobium favelukesii TaxID=348824 RepID=W6S777_9HYPH|nr:MULTISPECIES: L-seryl-tRNA(Sec) selenium transferase [Rhizobium]MCA0804382.1 L-seryl-tRNA(Sec) selenium transferase [Rhizobium sp. T1473]MCS0459613.1 L-seryl-tRNA(Sec) selenium transferase [Rhizobium favelukesii]UFS80250.1 L-seryl-tRNA(Sec) selenium transferase [Rhizobium sp. T136]CDM62041.1 L-seryl-tRNA(Sec) selenium transferase [Rhizobium favelukesii]